MIRDSLCCATLLIALTVMAGLARAGEVGGIVDDDAWSTADPAAGYLQDETTGSIDRSIGIQTLPLSDEQRGWIFLSVINLPDTPEALPAPDVAETVPGFVALRDLPAMATSRIPFLLDYKFVKLDDRILVVRPGDRVIVSQIPRYRLVQ
jgi:hypothetical protein